ncbi:chorismate synthase [Clostridium thermosuccinogenes]|uniref:Chorismate synthase n=1 Tax=Clostridium thermosuccinogenes TaxID=84032 RepID=A0A2K2FEY7_9CLOT|nr:chorismate synthase [Pseudoclostridium thermosuccinogenes]AUS97633.1 chorismate synthase [Pseudoclostridium thermosuccinogenes]PNT97347.1 chorismate synthase [Pseudoclostridium thermosuccinogenes]PNT99283.1 chorismate synthase [Pseudoclostridium thermosuccinogenes]
MSGSIFGKVFQISTWGESHGKALGVVIDGCPAGISLCEEDIQKDLDKRKPGNSPFSTPRKEDDRVEILSGVFEGKTTGTPISLIVHNTNQRSSDYTEISRLYRPGHADYTYDQKYGFRDYRGGGRSSGRETTARVAAGAVAKKILSELGVSILTYTLSIGPVQIDKTKFDADQIYKNFLAMPDADAAQKAAEFLMKQKESEDSSGGIVECVVTGLPAGVGEPVFEKLDAMLGKAIFSIGAVKGVEFGSGFKASSMSGSENNDFYRFDEKGELTKLTNNSGGILGGISDGFPIILRAAFKPTPSIHKTQKTVNKQGENIDIQVEGRHDPVIVPRAVIVVESMVALTLVDYLFQRVFSRMDLIKKALS